MADNQQDNTKKLTDEVIKLLWNFQVLSFDDKKKKLLNVIKAIWSERDSLMQVKDAILNNSFVDDEFLDGVYTDIMSFADAIKQWNKKKAMQSLQDSQNYLKQLHKREQKEKEQEEWELENMLWELDEKKWIKFKKKSSVWKYILIFILTLLVVTWILFWLHYFWFINI